MVKGIGPSGANFQAPVQAHHMYVWHTHTQNALDDPTRPSGAPGLVYSQFLHFCGI